jgi:2-iminobutanoate/2-iminopropanoate deaminase
LDLVLQNGRLVDETRNPGTGVSRALIGRILWLLSGYQEIQTGNESSTKEGESMRKTIMAEKGPAPAGPYSHAVVAGDFVFISGQGPVNPETGTMPDGFTDQVRQTFENVRTILEAAGSSLDNVVKVNAYVTDLTRFGEFNEVYKEYFKHDPPARTTIAAALLGMLVEVDCIAVVE